MEAILRNPMVCLTAFSVAHHDFPQRRGCFRDDFAVSPLPEQNTVQIQVFFSVGRQLALCFGFQTLENQNGIVADGEAILFFHCADLLHQFGCGASFVELHVHFVGHPLADERWLFWLAGA